MDEMNVKAMKQALANVKSLAKKAVVEKYKSKNKPAPAAEVATENPAEELAEEVEETSEAQDSDDDDGMTELVIMSHGQRKAKMPDIAKVAESMPKRKRGRPPKQK